VFHLQLNIHEAVTRDKTWDYLLAVTRIADRVLILRMWGHPDGDQSRRATSRANRSLVVADGLHLRDHLRASHHFLIDGAQTTLAGK
jgi:hypothetical protein